MLEVDAPKLSLGELAYREIRRQILHGELAPGDFISERMLSRRLNAGQAAVRVAVQRLATQGFITVQPRRGIIVRAQSIQDVIDLFEVRILVEQRVMRSLAGRITPAQIETLRECIARMMDAAELEDAAAIVEADFGFHRTLCEFHGNGHLTGILDRILDGLYREVWTMTARHPWKTNDVMHKHETVIQALQEGDATRAEAVLAEHLRLGEQFVLSRKPPA